MVREKKQREKLWEEAAGHCLYCGHPVSVAEMEVDHIVPLSLGGENEYANKVCVCPCCNAAKANQSLEHFYATLGDRRLGKIERRLEQLARQGKMPVLKVFSLSPEWVLGEVLEN